MKPDQIITTVLLIVYMVIGYYLFRPNGIINFWVSMIAANITVSIINAKKETDARKLSAANRNRTN